MSNQEKIPNVHVLLEKIEDFVDSVPSEQNDKIDWYNLKQQKEGARLALNNLFLMFGNTETKSVDPCKYGNPKK